MSRNTAVAAVVVLVLIIGGWFLTRPKQSTTPSSVTEQTPTPVSTESASPLSATEGAMMDESKDVVVINTTGFSPKDITISVSESITWINSDTADHIVDSAPHPIHTAYPPLNLGTINPGEKKSLTFPKAGIYKYHDHLNPTLSGSITVQ